MHLIMEIMKQNNEHWLQNYQLLNELCIMSTNFTLFLKICNFYLWYISCNVLWTCNGWNTLKQFPCQSVSGESPGNLPRGWNSIIAKFWLAHCLCWFEKPEIVDLDQTHHTNYRENIILQGRALLTPLRWLFANWTMALRFLYGRQLFAISGNVIDLIRPCQPSS